MEGSWGMIRPFQLVPGHLFARLSADIEGLRDSKHPVHRDGDDASVLKATRHGASGSRSGPGRAS